MKETPENRGKGNSKKTERTEQRFRLLCTAREKDSDLGPAN